MFILKNNIWLRLLLAAVFCLPLGCGKKGPPVPPRQQQPATVGDLQYRIEGERVVLSWSVPGQTQKGKTALSGFSVYRSKESKTDSCPGCPVLFEKVADIPMPQVETGPGNGRKASYAETLEKGYRYVYKITVRWGQTQAGLDSNLVDFEY